MRKRSGGLFKKYFSIYAMTLVICTFMLGVIMLYFSTQYFRTERQEALAAACEKGVAATVQNTYVLENGVYKTVRQPVEEVYELIYNNTNATVFLCNVYGKVQICSEGDACTHTTYVVPENILNGILKNGYHASVGNLGGFFKQSSNYTYGVPVVIGDTIVGYVFAYSSVNSLFSFMTQIAVMFLISSFIMLLGSSVVIYFSTRILTRPLSEMSQAAQEMSVGDFSKRVEVEGDDEIARLATVFNQMAGSLDELETARRSFVANVSHELRTPMTTIGGYIDGMLDGTIGTEAQPHYLQVVSNEVKRLSRLTTSLLSIARMDAGEQQANIMSHNVWDIILEVMWSAERRIVDKRIEVKSLNVVPQFVMCDRDMLHQVIYNLIDNAIKFAPEGGYLAIEVEPLGAETHIRVRNNGAGIPASELSLIFQRFYKTDKSRALDKTGTGLGLYIAKTLAQRMEGDLLADSVVNEYTEFTILLNTGKEARGKEPAKPEPEKPKESWLGRKTKAGRKEKGAHVPDEQQQESRRKQKKQQSNEQ